MSESYFSVAQAAGKVGLDFTEIVRAIHSRKLHAGRVEGAYRIRENDLLKFIHEHFKPKH